MYNISVFPKCFIQCYCRCGQGNCTGGGNLHRPKPRQGDDHPRGWGQVPPSGVSSREEDTASTKRGRRRLQRKAVKKAPRPSSHVDEHENYHHYESYLVWIKGVNTLYKFACLLIMVINVINKPDHEDVVVMHSLGHQKACIPHACFGESEFRASVGPAVKGIPAMHGLRHQKAFPASGTFTLWGRHQVVTHRMYSCLTRSVMVVLLGPHCQDWDFSFQRNQPK